VGGGARYRIDELLAKEPMQIQMHSIQRSALAISILPSMIHVHKNMTLWQEIHFTRQQYNNEERTRARQRTRQDETKRDGMSRMVQGKR
jgi:hypothetical protein